MSGPKAAAPKALAIFDFDLTLTRFHVWGTFRNAPLKEIEIDQATFVDVAIATFGRRDVVDKAMRFALGETHGVAISTPADHADPRYSQLLPGEEDRPMCPEGSDLLGSKNVQIHELCDRLGVDLSQASLVDDDANNVASARAAGIWAEHVGKAGCDRAVFQLMLDRLADQVGAQPPRS